jgi:2-dehydro-3-deoxygluconokinase
MNHFDALTFGETMALFIPPAPGPMETCHELTAGIAGTESNFAIGLVRLGHSVCWVSRVGNDPFGKKILKTLRGESVNVDHVHIAEDAPTGLMFKELRASGPPNIFYYRRGSAASAIDVQQFEDLKSRFLFVTGITPALSESNLKATLRIVDQFKAAGTAIVFDPNMRYKLWKAEKARPVFLQLAAKSNLLLPSLDEARILTGFEELDQMATALLKLGADKVAIKAGNQGAYFADGTSSGLIPPFSVQQIDPIGAGDAFCAGVVSGLLDKLPFRDAVVRGCAMGAICVTAYGDYAALPDRLELERFLAGSSAHSR